MCVHVHIYAYISFLSVRVRTRVYEWEILSGILCVCCVSLMTHKNDHRLFIFFGLLVNSQKWVRMYNIVAIFFISDCRGALEIEKSQSCLVCV